MLSNRWGIRTCNNEEGGVGAGQVQRHQRLRRREADVQLQRLPTPQHLHAGALPHELLGYEVPERDALARPAALKTQL